MISDSARAAHLNLHPSSPRFWCFQKDVNLRAFPLHLRKDNYPNLQIGSASQFEGSLCERVNSECSVNSVWKLCIQFVLL